MKSGVDSLTDSERGPVSKHYQQSSTLKRPHLDGQFFDAGNIVGTVSRIIASLSDDELNERASESFNPYLRAALRMRYAGYNSGYTIGMGFIRRRNFLSAQYMDAIRNNDDVHAHVRDIIHHNNDMDAQVKDIISDIHDRGPRRDTVDHTRLTIRSPSTSTFWKEEAPALFYPILIDRYQNYFIQVDYISTYSRLRFATLLFYYTVISSCPSIQGRSVMIPRRLVTFLPFLNTGFCVHKTKKSSKDIPMQLADNLRPWPQNATRLHVSKPHPPRVIFPSAPPQPQY